MRNRSPREYIFAQMAGMAVLFVLVLGIGGSADAREAGYDENTEVVIRGTIRQGLAQPYLGLQCFIVQTKSRLFRVLTAPHWFARQVGLIPETDSEVEVVGSKFYRGDGSICLLARSLTFLGSGKTVVLRDTNFRPIWKVPGCRESSCLRIFHSPR